MPRQGQELATSQLRVPCLCPQSTYCDYSIPRPARFLARAGAALAVANGLNLAPQAVRQAAAESLPRADTLSMDVALPSRTSETVQVLVCSRNENFP